MHIYTKGLDKLQRTHQHDLDNFLYHVINTRFIIIILR